MRKSLSFSKGLTNVPSDLLSSDAELVESLNVIFRDGELHPIQKPVSVGTLSEEIVCVHRGNGYTNIITHSSSNINAYKYAEGSISPIGSYSFSGTFKTAGAVGNTLVVSTTTGISYLRFSGGTYSDLGAFPTPRYSVMLSDPENFESSNVEKITFTDYIQTHGCNAYYSSDDKLCKIEELLTPRDDKSDYYKSAITITSSEVDESKTLTYLGYCMKYGKQTELNAAAQAVFSTAYADVKKNNCFAFPFFVRMALRLYDGSYARISAPILCLPSIRNNGALYPSGRVVSHESLVKSDKMSYFQSDMKKYELTCYFHISEMSQWSDIIKNVVVFATPEVLPYDIDGDWVFKQPSELMKMKTWEACLGALYYSQKWTYARVSTSTIGTSTDGPLTPAIMPSKFKSDENIMSRLKNGMTFYKVIEFAVNESTSGKWLDSTKFAGEGVVENLTSQEQLSVDDYYGWATKTADGILSYNNRAQLYGVKRYPYKGFRNLVNAISGNPFTAYVHIVAPTMDAWVESECATIEEALYSWYYYPDPNATEVRFVKKGMRYSLKLEPHPRLNGAYAMVSLPDGSWPDNQPDMEIPTADSTAYEDLSSQIFTSVVNNPFVFEASGDNTVGSGKILGVAANTEPISQGQFGQYPLIVFTDEGIYAMSVSDEGMYSASHPLSREVCNNARSITPTGSLVFFSSERGLMAVSGGAVACVSEQLSGRAPRNFVSVGNGRFLDFLRTCVIAYDYRDSLLHIYSTANDYKYVYSIKDHTFGKVEVGYSAMAVANVYPDNLVQDADGNVRSFAQRPDVNSDSNKYSGSFVTRPLKMDSSIELKSLTQILHLYDSAEGTLTLRVYGSNDCRTWNELRSLRGKPWKYYTFQYAFSDFAAADSFAGTVVDFQPRFVDKMR